MLSSVKDKILSVETLIADKTSCEFVHKNDQEIWKAFKRGSEIAFAYIYEKNFQLLYRYGSQFSRDREFIKDAIHDLFVELLKKRQKLSDTTSIKYYLFKSLKVNIISKLRKKKIDYRGELDGYDFALSMSIEDNIIATQIDDEKKQRIENAIKKLKSIQREIIYYYYFENLDLSQIASLMRFSNQKSAQNLLYRSLAILRKSLGVCWCLVLMYLVLLLQDPKSFGITLNRHKFEAAIS